MGKNNYSKKTKDDLLNIINFINNNSSIFVKNPSSDFTRNRKMNLGDTLKTMLSMEGGSLKAELLKTSKYDINLISSPGFSQQREKIKLNTFEFLFNEYTKTIRCNKTYNGYKILACDGSVLNIAHNPNDKLTYINPTKKGAKGHNSLHLNALYDVMNNIYIDSIIQDIKQSNEKEALNIMLNRYNNQNNKTIIVADRGYESYNTFAHLIENDFKFIIRAKDISSNGILSSLNLPNEEFDKTFSFTLCSSRAKEYKENIYNYKYVEKENFDYKVNDIVIYPIKFRVIRFKISNNNYECIITNLNSIKFPPNKIKELYHLRWGIETSFRELKYNIGIINFHSKKKEFVKQEVFIKLTMYNMCQAIMQQVVIKQRNTKYNYKINATIAFQLCKQYFREKRFSIKRLTTLICKNLEAIRPDRKDERKIKPKNSISFTYRVAA